MTMLHLSDDICHILLYNFPTVTSSQLFTAPITDFQYPDISAVDQNRLSAFKLNTLRAMSKAYTHPDTAFDFLMNLESYHDTILPPSLRNKKGTFLKPGTLLSLLFPLASSDKLSDICHRFTAALRLKNPNNSGSLLLESDTPSKIYPIASPSFTSCMKETPDHWFYIYDDLEDTSILYMLDPTSPTKELLGRALLHRNIEAYEYQRLPVEGDCFQTYDPIHHDGLNVMDRIYFADEDVKSQFINWAKANSFYYKTHQSVGYSVYFGPPDYTVSRKLHLIRKTLKLKGRYTHVPYIDTLRHYYQDHQILSSRSELPGLGYSDTTLDNIDGSDEEHLICDGDGNVEHCELCGCSIDLDSDPYSHTPNDAICCEDCFSERFTSCANCDGTVDNDDIIYIESDSEYICSHCFERSSRDYFTCHDCEESFRGSRVDRYEVDGDWICEDCINTSKYFQCEECGDYFRAHDAFTHGLADGFYCETCYDALLEKEEEDENV